VESTPAIAARTDSASPTTEIPGTVRNIATRRFRISGESSDTKILIPLSFDLDGASLGGGARRDNRRRLNPRWEETARA
jgi:hypothetical protein